MILDKKFRIFLVVAELGSFSQAARRLSMSQSAISFHVNSLETEAGFKLFQRHGRTITLTPEGEYLYKEGLVLAGKAKRLSNYISELSETIAKQVHLAGSALMCAFTFPWTLLEFRELYAGAELIYQHLGRDELVDKLLEGDLDLGLVGHAFQHRKLISQVCFSSPLILVGKMDAPDTVSNAQELQQLPLLWSVGDEGIELLLSQQFNKLGVPPKDLNIVLEMEDLNLLKTSIQAGLGCCFLPEMTVQNELQTGIFKRIEVENFSVVQTTYLLARREHLREVVQKFWDYVAQRREAQQGQCQVP